MITTLGMPALNDAELDDLIRTDHAGMLSELTENTIVKLKLYCSNASSRDKGGGMPQVLPLIFQRVDGDDVPSRKTPPQTPPSADASGIIRKLDWDLKWARSIEIKKNYTKSLYN